MERRICGESRGHGGDEQREDGFGTALLGTKRKLLTEKLPRGTRVCERLNGLLGV